MSKNRIRLIANILVILFVVSISAGCGSNSAKPAEGEAKPIVMKLANVSPVGDPRDQAAKLFAEAVEKKTAGKVKIEVFSGGTLGGFRDTIEGLKPGTVNIVIESMASLEPYSPLAPFDMMPFVYRDDDHYLKVWNGEIGKQILQEVAKGTDFVVLGPQYRGARYITSKKPIHSVADMKGMKIRSAGSKFFLSVWESLGAAPFSLDPAEIYTGLQQGAVVAQENPLSANYAMAMYEVCPYLIATKHMYPTDVVIFDKAYFEALPTDVQTAINEAAAEAAKWRGEFELASQSDYIQKFKDKKVTVIEPDNDSFREKLQTFYDALSPQMKDYFIKIQAVK